MARYFFDFFEETMRRDTVGVECATQEDICREAMLALPEVAKGKIPKDGQKQFYTVLVRNESNVTVYTATLSFTGVWAGEDIPPAGDPLV